MIFCSAMSARNGSRTITSESHLPIVTHIILAPDRQIPEPFVWLMLSNISEAIYNFSTCKDYTSKAERANEASDTGKTNVTVSVPHRDIKLSNIFLKESEDPCGSYPFPVVADFDGMISLSEENEGSQKGTFYTPTYAAPVSAQIVGRIVKLFNG